MQRTVFNEDHDAFRKTIRDFIAKEVAPVHHAVSYTHLTLPTKA